jgi:hypothetical protein
LEFYQWALGEKEGTPQMWNESTELTTTNLPTNANGIHYVYQFSLDGKLENDITKPDLTKVFNLTAENEKEWLAYVKEDAAKSNISSAISESVLLGNYYSAVMSRQWGGINFDASVFSSASSLRSPWKYYVERASGCLWNPVLVLGLPEIDTNTLPPPSPYQTSFPIARAGKAPLPSAVLSFATSKTQADSLLATHGERLSVAGIDKDNQLVFFVFRGRRLGSTEKGGRRGRTFRRKAKRSNKNGGRPSRKSKHDVRRNRNT